MDRTDELRRKISLVHSVNSNTVNKPIYAQKGYNGKGGIKCTEKVKKIGMKKCMFKNSTSFSVDLPKEKKFLTLLDPIIKLSKHLKLILVHILRKVFNNT